MSERLIDIEKRRFLKKTAFGAAYLVAGLTDGYFNFKKGEQVHNEAERELERKGLINHDRAELEKAFDVQRQERIRIQRESLGIRPVLPAPSQDGVQGAENLLAEQKAYNIELYNHKHDKRNTLGVLLRTSGDVGATYVGGKRIFDWIKRACRDYKAYKI